MAKLKLYTRKQLRRHRLRQQAELEEERQVESQLKRTPRKWRNHTLEMNKVLKGITWHD